MLAWDGGKSLDIELPCEILVWEHVLREVLCLGWRNFHFLQPGHPEGPPRTCKGKAEAKEAAAIHQGGTAPILRSGQTTARAGDWIGGGIGPLV